MYPVILIRRTMAGDAFIYDRYDRADIREWTDAAQLDPVPPGTQLPALSAEDVELLRTDPAKFFNVKG